ncbi:MAG: hypothetical protein B6D44_00565, partial [Ignavibacteriales bacterium UTCHB2]
MLMHFIGHVKIEIKLNPLLLKTDPMEPLPIISVLFITYRRFDLLKRTYDSFLANTDYPREKLELILCDDGSPQDIQNDMRKLKFDKYLFATKNEGMAANVNKGLKEASGLFILQLQDDWICKGPPDYLKLGVNALEEDRELGLIRYRLGIEYLYTSKSFNNGLNEIHILSRDQKDTLKRKYYRKDTFLYSDNPHLKRKELHDSIGMYKSYKYLPQIELDFCIRFNSSHMYSVGYIAGFEEVFSHIGELQSNR